jgi:hypothetical protein
VAACEREPLLGTAIRSAGRVAVPSGWSAMVESS